MVKKCFLGCWFRNANGKCWGRWSLMMLVIKSDKQAGFLYPHHVIHLIPWLESQCFSVTCQIHATSFQERLCSFYLHKDPRRDLEDVFKEFQESSLALGLSCNFSALES
jgi:hypothetical protein